MKRHEKIEHWANQFPILQNDIFLNHAAVAPICPPAAQALRDYAQYSEQHAYIRSNWYPLIEAGRKSAATLINAKSPDEIAYIPNTSTGLALVARGLDWHKGDEVVITNVEYPANRYPWEDLKRFGVRLVEVKQDENLRVPVEAVLDAITDRTRVVSLSHVQYATGYRTQLRPIADLVHQAGGLLCVDAIQSLGVLPVDVQEMGIDFLAADGHKWLLAPEGAGIFYCRQELIEDLHPAVVGWMSMVNAQDYGNYQFEFKADARRFEPGTWNVPGTMGLAASIDMLLDIGIDNVWAQIFSLTKLARELIEKKNYKVVSPSGEEESSGIVTFVPTDASADPKKIIAELEKKGVIVAFREGRLRMSPHFYNTPEQIEKAVAALP